MAIIQLTQGKHAIVNDEDRLALSRFKWCARYDKRTKRYFAGRTEYLGRDKNGKKRNRTIQLHRQVLGLQPGDRRLVVFKDGNTLNCCRENLEAVPWSQKCKADRQPYKGVAPCGFGKWRARLEHEGVEHLIGYYQTPEEAARAYNAAARDLIGPDAELNKLPEQAGAA